MCYFPVAAAAHHHRLGDFKQPHLFSHGSGGQKSNIKVSAGLSPENHHLCVFQSFMVTLISIPLGIVLARLEALPLSVLPVPSFP